MVCEGVSRSFELECPACATTHPEGTEPQRPLQGMVNSPTGKRQRATLALAKTMTTSSQVFAATVTRDYVPVVANTTAGDPRLLLLGSHYQRQDSAGTAIGGAPHNETASAITIDGHTYPAANEAGGDKLIRPKPPRKSCARQFQLAPGL